MKKVFTFYLFVFTILLSGRMVLAQNTISNLELQSSSGNDLTNDDLYAYFDEGASVVETALAWYRNGTSINTLLLPFEGDYPDALLDYSGNNNNATTSGINAPVWAPTGGHNGAGAFVFDGIDDFLLISNALPLNSSYTKTAWINIADTASGFMNIISSTLHGDNNHYLYISDNGELTAGQSFGSVVVNGPDSLNHQQWYFVAVTFEYPSGEMVLYEDGYEVARDTVPAEFRSVIDPSVRIGVKGTSFWFDGTIDDARIYNFALSPDQIHSLWDVDSRLITAPDTRGGDTWFVDVTPFSATDVGTTVQSNFINLGPAPAISGLSLAASSPENLPTDDLLCTYTTNPSVVATAAAWYRNGSPEALLHLPFEGGHGNNLLDFSGSGNNARYDSEARYSWPTYEAGDGHDGGSSFYFNGYQYLIAGDVMPLSASYTKTAWIRLDPDGDGYFRNIISSATYQARDHTLKVTDDGHLAAGHYLGEPFAEDPLALSLDQWYFVAVTFDFATSQMILYKNGNVVDTQTLPDSLRNIVDPSVLIGALDYGFNFMGNIDDPKIFGHVLSPQQIMSMYTTGNDVIMSEETNSSETWRVDVTPFAYYEAGTTVVSNNLNIGGLNVSVIPDQTVPEGSTFATINLDDYVTDPAYTDNQITWSSFGSTELIVTINPSTRVATIGIPTTDWYGSEAISFVATNPILARDTAQATFTVTNINDAPVITNIGAQNTPEDTNLTGLAVTFTDADPSDTHTITVVSDEANVVVANLSGQVSGSTYDLELAANWSGTAHITVTVTDNGTGPLSDFETYTLTVNPVNDAPVLTEIGNQSIAEGTSLNGLAVVFTDADASDTHTITVVSDEANVAVQNLSGQTSGSTYNLVPAAFWSGTAHITVTVTDNGTGPLSDTETYTLTVTGTNDPPVLAEIGDQSTMEDTNLTGLAVVYTDPDAGDTHTITVVSDQPGVTMGNLSGQTSGSTYDLVLAADWYGTAHITVTVTDNGTLFDSETYTLTVTPVNDAPVITEVGDQSINEGTSLLGLSVVYIDPDPLDAHSVSVVSSDPANVAVQNFNGTSYDLVPGTEWYGTAQITVTVTDNGTGNLSDTEIYTLTVNNINDAPVLTAIGNQTTNEDVSLTGLPVNFTDADPTDAHVITVVSNNANVTVANLSGQISGSTYDLVPAAEWSGTAQITVTVTDNGTGPLFATETYTLTVNSVNDAPVLTPVGDQNTDEGVTVAGLAVVFTDADPGDTHTITVVSNNANVTVANLSGQTSGSTYDLVPAAYWNGSAQITVTVTDNGAGPLSGIEVYTLTVNSYNDAPVISLVGNQVTDEDVTLSGVPVVFTDTDAGDTHTITVVSDNANVTVANLSGQTSGSTYSLIPATNWNGTAQITVTVTDNGIGTLSDMETYTLTVNPVNDAPVLTPIGNQVTAEGATRSGLLVVFTDVDVSDTHTITIVSNNANVTVANLSGQTSGSTYDLVPAQDWNGTAQITVTVTDNGTGPLSDSETYSLTVSGTNDAPVLTIVGDLSTNEDVSRTGIPVIFTDPDPTDLHTITVVSSEANVTVANLTGQISGSTYDLVPAANWNGTAQITVTVTDNGAGALSDYETYTFTVNPVNDAPTDIQLSSQSVDERVPLGTMVGVLSATDIDVGDSFTYSLVAGSMDDDNGDFFISHDTLRTNAEIDYETKTIYLIRIQVSDGEAVFSLPFAITVNDVNETGVEENPDQLSFSVYPVPAVSEVTVEFNNPENNRLHLEIYNSIGSIVHSEYIFNSTTIDISEFRSGMYIVVLKGENVFGTRRIIVED